MRYYSNEGARTRTRYDACSDETSDMARRRDREQRTTARRRHVARSKLTPLRRW